MTNVFLHALWCKSYIYSVRVPQLFVTLSHFSRPIFSFFLGWRGIRFHWLIAMGYTKTVIRAGNGVLPRRGQTVTVHCTGYGKDRDLSKKFWSTKDPGQEPFSFAVGLGQVIKVWNEDSCLIIALWFFSCWHKFVPNLPFNCCSVGAICSDYTYRDGMRAWLQCLLVRLQR